MSNIHYFQRYSQKENVVTNNTLLLFSRLYHQYPLKFKAFLNELMEDIELNVGIEFSQQTKAKASIPDGSIFQESFKLSIETKLGDSFKISQLENHLKSFGNESTQILIGLSPLKISDRKSKEFIKVLSGHNSLNNSDIKFVSITFDDVINSFKEILDDFDIELLSLIEDYEDFCLGQELIQTKNKVLLTVPCGHTLDDNFKYNIYYDPADRGHSHCTHLGIYKQKRIHGVGLIENIVFADLTSDNELQIHNSSTKVTEDQKTRIIQTIHAALKNTAWNIKEGEKFWCVDKFYHTKFDKSSKGGLWGKRYFDLSKLLGQNEETSTEEIANTLKGKTWR